MKLTVHGSRFVLALYAHKLYVFEQKGVNFALAFDSELVFYCDPLAYLIVFVC